MGPEDKDVLYWVRVAGYEKDVMAFVALLERKYRIHSVVVYKAGQAR